MPFYLRSPEASQVSEQDPNPTPTIDKGKGKETSEDKDKDKEAVPDDTSDDMAPGSGYYEASRSSSEGVERVHYDSRKERRSGPKPSNPTSTRPKPVVINHPSGTKSTDPKRPSSIDGARWK